MQQEKSESKVIKWFKRLGVAGFLFFTIKGLIWIAVFALAYFGFVSWQ